MTNRILFGRFLLILLVATLTVQITFAVDKVGTTSMQVLKTPFGVRGIGMGNAGVASTLGIESVWWNPAVLTDLCGPDFLISQINMPADVQLNSLVYGNRLNSSSAYTLHAINLFTDDMPVRTFERPEGTGEFFNAYDFIIGGSYARKLTDKFSLGGNLRYLYSGLEDETYSGFSVDLGTMYKTSLRSMRLAMAVQNLGPDVQYSGSFLDYRNYRRNGSQLIDGEYDGARLPTLFRLGIGFDAFELLKLTAPDNQSASVSLEMNHPNDNRERLNLGGEWGYREQFFVRLGGKFGYDEESWSAGFGLHVPVSGFGLRFDYAYSHWGHLSEAADGFGDQTHRMQIGFDLCRESRVRTAPPPRPKSPAAPPVEKAAEPPAAPKPETPPAEKPVEPVPVLPDTTGQAERKLREEMDADLARLQPIYFDLDRSEIRADQSSVLAMNIEILSKWQAWSIELTGSTDERASDDYNRSLAKRRCETVKAAMVKAGISTNRFLAFDVRGESNPADPAHNESAWQKNRRVDVAARRGER